MQFLKIVLAFGIVSLVSCTGQREVIKNYLQKVDSSGTVTTNMPEPRIQVNDHLSIKVYSVSADPRTDIPYNLPEQLVAGSSNTTATAGFLVDADGNIEYPTLGTIHVAGLTKTELAKEIKDRLKNVLINPSVIVRFLNYKVTVLGEVRSPGTFTLPTERITILEALGLAGDVTEFGNKDSVKVAREKNDVLEIGYVSLTSKDLFNSPYYRLQQNDVIFVDQNRRRIAQEEQQNTLQRIGIITSIASTLAIIFNVIKR